MVSHGPMVPCSTWSARHGANSTMGGALGLLTNASLSQVTDVHRFCRPSIVHPSIATGPQDSYATCWSSEPFLHRHVHCLFITGGGNLLQAPFFNGGSEGLAEFSHRGQKSASQSPPPSWSVSKTAPSSIFLQSLSVFLWNIQSIIFCSPVSNRKSTKYPERVGINQLVMRVDWREVKLQSRAFRHFNRPRPEAKILSRRRCQRLLVDNLALLQQNAPLRQMDGKLEVFEQLVIFPPSTLV